MKIVYPEERPFWCQILSRRNDALVRFVFADWLADRADPRADALRVLGRYRVFPLAGANGWLFWNLCNYATAMAGADAEKRVVCYADVVVGSRLWAANTCARAMVPDPLFAAMVPLAGYPEDSAFIRFPTPRAAVYALVDAYTKLSEADRQRCTWYKTTETVS